MRVFAEMGTLALWYSRIIEDAPLIVRDTHAVGGQPVTDALARTLDVYVNSIPDDRKELFARYRIVDVARKVVGVGSVGTRCWVILFSGNGTEDPLFLQYKEAQPSVLAPYSKSPQWESEGQRVVVGQRTIQGAPDIFLGWGVQTKELGGSHSYIRQLRDMKGGIAFDPKHVKTLPEYCVLCGWALALAHAKSGDSAAIAGYPGKSDGMDEAVARFAFAYAKQTDRDYDALVKAAGEKRTTVSDIKEP